MWNELICRFCGEINKNVIPIFDKTNKYNLEEKIKICIPIKISEDDQKPKHICQQCCEKITQFYDFIELCQHNELKYQSLLYENSTKWLSKSIENSKEPLNKLEEIGTSTENFYLMEFRSENPKKGSDEENKINDATKNLVLTYNTSSDTNLMEIPIYNTYQITETRNTYSSQIETEPIIEEKTSKLVSEESVPENPKTKTKKTKQNFLCEICKKTFSRKANLNFHLAKHSNTRPFQCDKCDKKCISKHELNIHKIIHTGLHECPYCSKRFCAKGKLERHVRIHTGEKPFKCDICSKAFSDKRNLSGHFAVHINYRPFPCANCDKSFRVKSHLVEHQRVHTMEMPYICDTCGKRFKWKANLMTHLRSHTGELYNCLSCPLKFTQMKLLKRHTSRHHQKAVK